MTGLRNGSLAALALLLCSGGRAVSQQADGPYQLCVDLPAGERVSCLGAGRIRIAVLTGNIFETPQTLERFVYDNEGLVVRIDGYFEASDDPLLPFYTEDVVPGRGLAGAIGVPEPCTDCGGISYTIAVPPDYGGLRPVKPDGAYYTLRGYFIPRPVEGVHQGWIEMVLELVPRSVIRESGRFAEFLEHGGGLAPDMD